MTDDSDSVVAREQSFQATGKYFRLAPLRLEVGMGGRGWSLH